MVKEVGAPRLPTLRDKQRARQIEVPNCSDDIIVPQHGEKALLAPTTCVGEMAYDPISVIDLTAGAETFVRNLPGFGPVALGPDGTMAVGFLWDAQHCEDLIAAGKADMIALAREVLDDPNWPLHAAQELGMDDRFSLWAPAFGWWLDKRERVFRKLGLGRHQPPA